MQEFSNGKFSVGDWQVEPELNRITRDATRSHLRPQVMELLVYLARHPGQVVSAEEILTELWSGKIVSSGSVYTCVAELRQALDSDRDWPTSIETIPKKGYRLVVPVQSSGNSLGAIQGSGRPTWIKLTLPVLIAVSCVVIWLVAQNTFEPNKRVEIRSLAVLPLDNLSADPAVNEYLTDGMTEVLIARLGQIENLRVISRTSAMQLKDSDMTIPEIAATLQVDSIIEGSVLTVGEEVRVTLQLIDGRTDSHMWSHNYVRQLDDILALQSEMANSVAAELRDRFVAQSGEPLQNREPRRRPLTTSSDAYRAYLKGRYHFNRFGEDNFRAALDYYEQAINLDPDFGLAYASLAEACMQPAIIFNRIRTLEECGQDALRATEIDPTLAEAFAALGFTRLFNWQWQQAELDLQRAVRLDPNSIMAHQWLTIIYLSTYRFDEALAEIRKAEELDPLNLFVKTMVGWPLYDLHRYDEALRQWDDVIDMDSGFMLAHYNQGLAHIQQRDAALVFAAADRVADISGELSFEARLLNASGYAIAGDSDKSRKIMDSVERDGGDFMAAWIASIHLMMGDEDTALARLEKGLEDRSPDMTSISEPKFDAVRQHPRFRAVSRKMGLPNND